MRVVLTLLVRDEVDLIVEIMEYHLAEGIAHIIVTDNGSVDGTVEILERYAARGFVTLLHEPVSDYSQHRWVTRMARLAHAQCGADWVINGDADEAFVWRDGTLREALETIPEEVTTLRAERTDFVPFDLPERASPFIEMIYRKKVSLNPVGRPLPPKIIHRGVADVSVAQGNHAAQSSEFVLPAAPSEIEVFHYPVRSAVQFERKIRHAGSCYMVNKDLDPRQGVHKRRLYAQLLAEGLEGEFRERLFYDEQRLAQALQSGEVLVDRTVAERMLALPNRRESTIPGDS